MSAWIGTYRRACTIGAVLSLLTVAAALRPIGAQQRQTHGQTIAPAYEGFLENPDGTFSLVFGYLNRNYEELLDIPIGPDNNIEPGGPDQGQPTHFLTRRRRHQFQIKVPKDFGAREVVWTLTSRGKTERAYGTLKRDYILDNRVMMMNNSGFGQRGDEGDNQPPVVTLEGESRRTAKAGEAIALAAIVTDDGMPKPPGAGDRRPAGGGAGAEGATSTATESRPGRREYGLKAGWYVYRRAGSVTFEPEQFVRPYPPGYTPPLLAPDGRLAVKATFGAPGTYVLRATGDDMGLQTFRDVTITVVP
jgi:hypothetical protein